MDTSSEKTLQEEETKRSADDKWDTMYQRLLQYHKLHGNANVPSRYPQDPALGFWGKSEF